MVFIRLPEYLVGCLVTRNSVISLISSCSVLPWVCNTFCNKKHGSKCKNISILALIFFSTFYFWSHIHRSSKLGNHITILLSSFQIQAIPKINQLKFKILSDHYVFRFDVPMSHSCLVQQVYCFTNLLEDIADHRIGLSLTSV